MGLYEEQILPRVTDRALRGKEAALLRARVTAGLSGEVLEVGFGSGLNMPYHPPVVKRVRAVDPSAVARKLAAERVAASTVPVEYIGVDAQALQLEDASVDHVVSVLTLGTIPAVDRALAEIRRVLRPAGAFTSWSMTCHHRRRWPGGNTGSPRSSVASSEAAISTGQSTGWWWMPGNRDRSVFGDPDRFDVTRGSSQSRSRSAHAAPELPTSLGSLATRAAMMTSEPRHSASAARTGTSAALFGFVVPPGNCPFLGLVAPSCAGLCQRS